MKYADYALGYFLREAAEQPWFDNTVFVVVADHGARVYGKAEIPLETYEIPLMIYAPRHIAPRQVDTLMTQIDIAPTVLGLLGLPYEAPFFGVDVLHAPANEERIALFSHDHDVAILRGDRLAVLESARSRRRCGTTGRRALLRWWRTIRGCCRWGSRTSRPPPNCSRLIVTSSR